MKKIALLLFLGTSCLPGAKAAINQIRWGSSGSPLSGLTITWSNNGTADSIKWGYTAAFEKGKFITSKRAGYASGISFFKYVFPTVNPSATIYYRLYDSGTKSWGAQKTFATAPPLNTTQYSFCALGDCRDDLNVLTNISDKANARKATLTLFNGDLTLDGNSNAEYDAFFSAASTFLENNLVYHAQGNHDAGSTPTYSNIFDLPQVNGSNLYYSMRYGNALFITLNTEETSGQAAQLSWLQNTLSAANSDPSITWKVISFHEPFFTIGQHGGDMDSYRTSWWKAFDDYGVDLICNGHDHNYQRSKPVNLNVSGSTAVTQYGSAAGQGRCEIVSGGAGAGLYTQGSSADAWAMNLFNSTYNYVFCQVTDCKMKIVAYDGNDAIIDSLTLDKSGTAGCLATGFAAVPQKFNPVSIYPNPVKGSFTMHYSSEEQGEAIIRIADMAGREVKVLKAFKNQKDMDFSYDLSEYANGIYNISVTVGRQRDNALLVLSK